MDSGIGYNGGCRGFGILYGAGLDLPAAVCLRLCVTRASFTQMEGGCVLVDADLPGNLIFFTRASDPAGGSLFFGKRYMRFV